MLENREEMRLIGEWGRGDVEVINLRILGIEDSPIIADLLFSHFSHAKVAQVTTF